jgi:hypothetical protein
LECKVDSYIIQEYLEKTIAPLEKVFFEEHLKKCKKCRLELTHLKLLFFEMENLKETEDIPKDVEYVRKDVLDEIFKDSFEGFKIREFIKNQKEMVSLSTNFTNFLPGKKLVKKGFEKANICIKSASKKGVKFGLRYGLKLIQERI